MAATSGIANETVLVCVKDGFVVLVAMIVAETGVPGAGIVPATGRR